MSGYVSPAGGRVPWFSSEDGRSARAPVRRGPALGDQVAVPAQEGCRLDEEPFDRRAGEQLCQPGEQPAGRSGGRCIWRRRTATSWRSMTTSIAKSVLA
jgi:hypothetical protein